MDFFNTAGYGTHNSIPQPSTLSSLCGCGQMNCPLCFGDFGDFSVSLATGDYSLPSVQQQQYASCIPGAPMSQPLTSHNVTTAHPKPEFNAPHEPMLPSLSGISGDDSNNGLAGLLGTPGDPSALLSGSTPSMGGSDASIESLLNTGDAEGLISLLSPNGGPDFGLNSTLLSGTAEALLQSLAAEVKSETTSNVTVLASSNPAEIGLQLSPSNSDDSGAYCSFNSSSSSLTGQSDSHLLPASLPNSATGKSRRSRKTRQAVTALAAPYPQPNTPADKPTTNRSEEEMLPTLLTAAQQQKSLQTVPEKAYLAVIDIGDFNALLDESVYSEAEIAKLKEVRRKLNNKNAAQNKRTQRKKETT